MYHYSVSKDMAKYLALVLHFPTLGVKTISQHVPNHQSMTPPRAVLGLCDEMPAMVLHFPTLGVKTISQYVLLINDPTPSPPLLPNHTQCYTEFTMRHKMYPHSFHLIIFDNNGIIEQ